ncbi:MAG: hypothetical protein ACI9LU_002583, partial [Polaribacter sp.]
KIHWILLKGLKIENLTARNEARPVDYAKNRVIDDKTLALNLA